jgi:uncharacterized damage-inducible protein DinB
MKKTVSSQLANRFREVILNGRWIANTNLKEQVSELTWEQATTKIAPFNTIATLTFHIHYYIAGILNVLEGGSLDIKDKYSFDHPPFQSQADWDSLLNQLWHDAEKFADLVEKMPQRRLKEPFIEEKYGDYLRNIDGMIEHSYYHLGQIVLLKKWILSKN